MSNVTLHPAKEIRASQFCWQLGAVFPDVSQIPKPTETKLNPKYAMPVLICAWWSTARPQQIVALTHHSLN